MKEIKSIYLNLKRFNFTTLAGALTFYIIVNGGSLLFLITLIMNILDFDFSSLKIESDVFDFILAFLNTPSKKTPYYIILIITSLWSSSTLFTHTINIGEMIYSFKRKSFPFFKRILSIIFVCIFLIIIFIALMLIILSDFILSKVSSGFMFSLITLSLYLIVIFFVVVFLLLFVPPIRMRVKEVYKGAIFTITFWIIASVSFKIYLSIFRNFKAIYGALTFLIVIMIYIYLLSIGLIIGLILNLENNSKINEELF